jgi:dUTP pyrophosphatase
MIELKIKKLYPDAILPEYKSKEAAGLDLAAYVPDGILLKKNEVHFVKTGISIELPIGYFADIRPRSGFSTKNKIIIPNSPGTIDSDYRGELIIALLNLSTEDFFLEHTTRIAQLVVQSHAFVKIQEVSELSSTQRGSLGFGSTGFK